MKSNTTTTTETKIEVFGINKMDVNMGIIHNSGSSDEDSVGAALLLTSIMSIACQEVGIGALAMPSLEINRNLDPILQHSDLSSQSMNNHAAPKFSQLCSAFESEYYLHKNDMNTSDDEELVATPSQPYNRVRAVSLADADMNDGDQMQTFNKPQLRSLSKRKRAVSIDHDHKEYFEPTKDSCAVVSDSGSPPSSPQAARNTFLFHANKSTRKKSSGTRLSKKTGHKATSTAASVVSPGNNENVKKNASGRKTILRRKFSWKNYPELEAFLIANREEYLRHSALNYTIQQKQYNNRLTERLLELADEHGYVFDEEAFSFVTVRDRIRCYFKSYVQSSKKRGVIIGYAAKRAGLLSEEELERSAGTAGRIVVPN